MVLATDYSDGPSGKHLPSSDYNTHTAQTNTNTTNIAANTADIVANTADIADNTTAILALEGGLPAPTPTVTVAARNIDFGFCQSEIGHETWYTTGDIRSILAGIKAAGGTRVRVAAWWGVFESNVRNTFDWDGLDRCMNLCEEYGLVPLVCITSAVSQLPSYSTPTVADFANACGKVAARYGAEGTGQLQDYEIWNEPNHRAMYAPFTSSFGAAHYTTLLIAASNAIRAADSEAFIITAGLMSTVDFPPNDILPSTFLQGIYTNGGGNYFDAVGFHYYVNEPDFTGWVEPSTTETFYADLVACHDVMVDEGDSEKSIWVTETGLPEPEIEATQRAEWMAMQIELLRQLDYVSTFIVYNYRCTDNTLTGSSQLGAVTFDFVERQPYFDYVASINRLVKAVPEGSVTPDKIAAVGTPSSTTYLRGDGAWASPSTSSESDLVTLGSRFVREKEAYPLPAVSPAPLTTDGGIASGLPSPTTGLKFVAWTDSTAYNYQGNYMVAAGAGLNSALSLTTNQVAQNASTPRKYTFGALNNEFLPSTINVRFATDSTRVIPVWAYYSSYSGSNYTDAHLLVEHEGQMKHLSSSSSTLDGLPRTQSSGGGLKRRELLFSQRRFRRMRVILPGYCYFAGVYIDTLATIIKTPNLDLYMSNGDSWNEPTGASWSAGDSPGGGFPSGNYQCLGLPEYLSFETGQAHGTYAQGGTGEENANGVSGGNATGYNGTNASAMWSTSRINDLTTKFGPQYPIQVDIGGWNDGNTLGTPYQTTYQTRVAARYTKLFAAAATAGREIKAISIGIQPVDWILGDGGYRDLSDIGRAAAAASFPDEVLGSISIGGMWDNRTTSGQRSILCLSQGGVFIHLNISGNVSVAGHLAAGIGKLQCSRTYLEKTRQA